MIARSLMLGVAAAALMVSGAQAADLMVQAPPANAIYESPLFNFEGFYAGVTAGGTIADKGYANVGVVAGVNFMVADPILLGVEAQGDLFFNGDGLSAGDALILGRIGVLATNQVLVYAAGGVGIIGADNPSRREAFWAAGAGVEVAVTDSMSVRAEGLYMRTIDSGTNNEFRPVAGADASDAAKFTIGALWHF
jgi:outer membrane immunogenic protein